MTSFNQLRAYKRQSNENQVLLTISLAIDAEERKTGQHQ
jgi:hypothetical protein